MNEGKRIAGQTMMAAQVFHGGVCMPPRAFRAAMEERLNAGEILNADFTEAVRVYSIVVTPGGK